jgi:hypothetical protein
MRLSGRVPREAISETVIAAVVNKARETGRTQIVADSRCTALRLVVTSSADSRWLLFCYDKVGKLKKSSLGRYPKIGVEEARERAWKFRLQAKGIARPRRSTSNITLEKLIILYENSHETSVHWGKLRDRIIYALRPFVFRPWMKIGLNELQKYIDSYPSPGGMEKVLMAVKTIVAWAQEGGIIKIPTNTLEGVSGRGVGAELLGGLCRRVRLRSVHL